MKWDLCSPEPIKVVEKRKKIIFYGHHFKQGNKKLCKMRAHQGAKQLRLIHCTVASSQTTYLLDEILFLYQSSHQVEWLFNKIMKIAFNTICYSASNVYYHIGHFQVLFAKDVSIEIKSMQFSSHQILWNKSKHFNNMNVFALNLWNCHKMWLKWMGRGRAMHNIPYFWFNVDCKSLIAFVLTFNDMIQMKA